MQNTEDIGAVTSEAVNELVMRFGLEPPDPFDQDWEICVHVPLDTVPRMLEHMERTEIDRNVRYAIGAVLLATFNDLFCDGFSWTGADIEDRDIHWPRFVRALISYRTLLAPEIKSWSCAEATCEDEEFAISPHLRLAMS